MDGVVKLPANHIFEKSKKNHHARRFEMQFHVLHNVFTPKMHLIFDVQVLQDLQEELYNRI